MARAPYGAAQNAAREPTDPALLALRVPPHSVEAEQSLIGGLLLDNQAFDKIADLVTGEDFYRDDHRRIFRQVTKLQLVVAHLEWSGLAGSEVIQ